MNPHLPGEARRFVLTGAINTLATYALYLGLLPHAGYRLAYTVAYLAGIALAYLLNIQFVFRVRCTLTGLALFPLVYVIQYLLGISSLYAAVDLFGVPEQFALLVSIGVTVPVTFLLSRLVLTRRAPRPNSGGTP